MWPLPPTPCDSPHHDQHQTTSQHSIREINNGLKDNKSRKNRKTVKCSYLWSVERQFSNIYLSLLMYQVIMWQIMGILSKTLFDFIVHFMSNLPLLCIMNCVDPCHVMFKCYCFVYSCSFFFKLLHWIKLNMYFKSSVYGFPMDYFRKSHDYSFDQCPENLWKIKL